MLRDSRLSFKARGLLAMVLSNTEDWVVSADRLATEKDGRDSIRNGLRELKELGYAVYSKQHTPDGKFNSLWSFYDVPQEVGTENEADSPPPEKPSTANTATAKASSLEEPSKEKISKEETNGKEGASLHRLFVKLWAQHWEGDRGTKYSFAPKDTAQLKTFLSLSFYSEADLIALIQVARSGWRSGDQFINGLSTQIASFVNNVERIRSSSKPKVRADGHPGTSFMPDRTDFPSYKGGNL